METFEGYNARVVIDGDWLAIERKGPGRLGQVKGTRRIPIPTIVEVQVRPAGRLVNGFIRFAVPGVGAPSSKMTEVNSDGNAVIFRHGQAASFDRLRELVERRITEHHAVT